MRYWLLAGFDGDTPADTGFIDGDEIDAFWPQLGTRERAAGSRAFPLVFSDDQLVELGFRIRKFAVNFGYTMSGTRPSDSVTVEVSEIGVDVAIESLVSVDGGDEGGLDSFDFGDVPGAQFGFVIGGNSNFTVKENGVTTSSGTAVIGDHLWISSGFQTDGDTLGVRALTTPYYYQGGGNWLPSLELLFGCFALNILSSEDWTPGAGVTHENHTAKFMGFDLTVDVLIPQTWLSITDFTLEITPILWWEWRPAGGGDAIWDQLTGAEIGDHETQEGITV